VKSQLNAYDTLILEGGSLRCAFTAGVMDALMLLGPMRFQRTLGVSAGAMVMASYLAGQHKYFVRVVRELLVEGEFIRFSAAFSDEGVMNLAHLKRHVVVHAPLDLKALQETQRTTQAWVVMTHAGTGKAMYVQPQSEAWLNALVASATLPMWTRGQVKWGNDWVFDGGYSDPLPLNKALDLGAKRILVVRTRPSGDHITQSTTAYLASWWFQDRPGVNKLFEEGHLAYNDTVDRLFEGGDDQGRRWEEIAPPVPLSSDSMTVGPTEVMADYRLGLDMALTWWSRQARV
jgi:predicted patatin/cPLA2 family phospholipase